MALCKPMKICYCGKRALKLAFVLLIIMLPLYAQDVFLAGNGEGLFKIENFKTKKIWSDSSVLKICKTGNQWLFLTDKGLAASKDLKDFYYLNEKLPKKIIKNIDKNGNKTFIEKIPQLKDLEVHPFNPNIFVTATSSNVFLTRDSGKTWEDLGANHSVNGIKAVCVLDMPNSRGEKVLTVFVSHSIAGVSWKQPDVNSKVWNELNNGLKKGPEGVEEVSDIVFDQTSKSVQVYCVQTFSGIIYKLDWSRKIFTSLNKKEKELVCADSLNIIDNTVFRVIEGDILQSNLLMPKTQIYIYKNLFKPYDKIKNYLKKSNYLCAFVPNTLTMLSGNLSLSELWLLHDKQNQINPYAKKADGKKGIYTPTHQMSDEKSFENHLKTIKDNKLNALVIDMKDEAGFVRYESKNEDIKKYNGIKYTLDIEKFIKKAKAENIYLIARIVVFKDKNLYRYNDGQYAVKDKETGKPWQGYNLYNGEKEIIQEHWVDPYNEDVWKYNVDIAEELSSLGFDEIQFDYIRFPTDGLNLADARYPARESGMDKVSALMSFLAYSRERIKAPISIDIYGANGWYRTGARTGQEVELLAEFVDVICPMFYPSHFSQSFLAYKPAEERPYRIYHQGSYRNKLIARNKVIVRPWAQAFFIPVSYDKKYYDENYVKRQILGIKDSIDEGYIYWNNSGRYLDLRPDGEGL
ncbi:putative glycoside hydrolase [Treponema putidum]|uniref:putative glycoside hydrolase n=1 Tax=Treponema putidum TaxID=221027 RepID=UPI002106AD1C|nr:putative glycoside hydrolase [Treponema putidum]